MTGSDNKKIGMCVRYDCDNYGSMLQLAATQAAISKFSTNYEFIRYDKRNLVFIVRNLPRLINPYFVSGKIADRIRQHRIAKHPVVHEGASLRQRRFMEFRSEHFRNYSPVFKGYKQLRYGAERYDIVIVGSDQLWTPAGLGSRFYTLQFAPEKVRRVSYATSFGVRSIPWYQISRTRKFLSELDYVSTREVQGAEIIEALTGVKAFVALDPTLLFNAEEWDKIIQPENLVSEPYILCYFLGDNLEHREWARELSSKYSMKTVSLPFLDTFVEEDLDFADESMFDVGPADFLNLVRNASYVVTDSYHGTIFSILNHKNFATFYRTSSSSRRSRNSRIDSLLGELKLKGRIAESSDDLVSIISSMPAYDEIDSKLIEMRNQSWQYLADSLG